VAGVGVGGGAGMGEAEAEEEEEGELTLSRPTRAAAGDKGTDAARALLSARPLFSSSTPLHLDP
jgi:hypothetical protein